ncbi:MAG: hypothetical protein AMXMBFR7_48410 [Planctomycetota bacterium]
MTNRILMLAVLVLFVKGAGGMLYAAETETVLPEGVRAVWNLDKAWRESTPTRESVCLNGLWRWQPLKLRPFIEVIERELAAPETKKNAKYQEELSRLAKAVQNQNSGKAPKEEYPDAVKALKANFPEQCDRLQEERVVSANTEQWGYFKVPAPWPGITNYMMKDSQTLYPHPAWKDEKTSSLTGAWYEREVEVPAAWAGRRVAIKAAYVNSLAHVYVDGKKIGFIKFPDGELDLTAALKPGAKHLLRMQVLALPLRDTIANFGDTNAPKEGKAGVDRRGLCGDVFLEGTPSGARIAWFQAEPSVRKGELIIAAHTADLDPARTYKLEAKISEAGRVVSTLASDAFQGAAAQDGPLTFARPWKPEKLWDIHTPQHQYELELSLQDDKGKALDTLAPQRIGFRELWIDGRDFYLNGKRIFLSSVPFDNAQVGAAWANYEAAKESMLRLKRFGINYVYAHNYGCQPGAHLSFEEILRAADDVGMLFGLSQPHFGHYDWEQPDAEKSNGYREHAAFYARVAGLHPSMVFYVTSHNATDDGHGMNPEKMGLIYKPATTWTEKGRAKASRAEALIRSVDPSRIVYHHSSGGFGVIHTRNFYTNFVPVQEMSDWFEHWSSNGVKPVFTCEYGVPFTWDWAMYRGWYPAEGPPNGKRVFGSAKIPWEFCLAEWNAQFFGDRAYRVSETEKKNLRWEAEQFRKGQNWFRWDYPAVLGSSDFAEREPVFALYYAENWRAFRTWGMSANSPWEHGILYKLKPGFQRPARTDLKTDWDRLQRPGISPDYIADGYSRWDLAFDRDAWVPTEGALALERNNMPLLAYIAGKPASVTSKDHIFTAGETFEKQVIVINNSRQTVAFEASWSLALPQSVNGAQKGSVETGQQARIPLMFQLPNDLKLGEYGVNAKVVFEGGETQEDTFRIRVIERARDPQPQLRIALFDPKGETTKLLSDLKVKGQTVDAKTALDAFDLLIVGKEALTLDGPAPDLKRVRDGLKVILFEQSTEVLEQRLGFRVAEYGLRNAFVRVPDHPVFEGLAQEDLRDWRGSATLLSHYTKSERSRDQNYGFVFSWCGLPVTRLYRAGCRGNIASVLIEKPARGDFLALLDGGFSLQYSPLLEYREGKGAVWFCQMDVSGRSEEDPAARRLTSQLIAHVSAWKPATPRQVSYAGASEGLKHLKSAGIQVSEYAGGALSPDRLLVLGPDCGQQMAAHKDAVAAGMQAGAKVLAIGLEQKDIRASLPGAIETKASEYISSQFELQGLSSPFVGCGPAEVHNRDPREVPLVTDGAEVLGGGVLATAGQLTLIQLTPWTCNTKAFNTKRNFRRTSSLLARVLGNLGAPSQTPFIERFSTPAKPSDQRWLDGYYLDVPEAWDDPYRFFCW